MNKDPSCTWNYTYTHGYDVCCMHACARECRYIELDISHIYIYIYSYSVSVSPTMMNESPPQMHRERVFVRVYCSMSLPVVPYPSLSPLPVPLPVPLLVATPCSPWAAERSPWAGTGRPLPPSGGSTLQPPHRARRGRTGVLREPQTRPRRHCTRSVRDLEMTERQKERQRQTGREADREMQVGGQAGRATERGEGLSPLAGKLEVTLSRRVSDSISSASCSNRGRIHQCQRPPPPLLHSLGTWAAKEGEPS
eukprot:GHVU01219930.1.p1 GENE.GHVU01219930.1~~GHVU01219930.1.p1  ORF type:complete len:252 (-),score=12.98 GHVU01219930.1:204-959(-)